jgi:hypothetical protein
MLIDGSSFVRHLALIQLSSVSAKLKTLSETRRLKSAAVRLGLRAIAVAFFLTPVPASSEVVLSQNHVIGQVSHVDANSIIHLGRVDSVSSGFPASDSFAIRPWALEISPDALAAIVEERSISCNLVYEAEQYLVSDCYVRFEHPQIRGSIKPVSRLSELAEGLGIGRVFCSPQDVQFAQEFPGAVTPGMRREDCLRGE